ncbi:MAG: GNAT family N-acetyltransferase [Chloroflexi bacterium]|nr:MAG: GNAT family N-acetyltransferase [Chloroflexota bacterium]
MIEIESGCGGRPGLVSLEPSDRDLVTHLFYRLSPESVYRRFFSPTTKPDQLIGSVLRLDHHDREAIAATDGGEVVGMAQYSRLPGAREADLAIVVADGWQRQGLGTRLVAALAERAAEKGVDRFTVDIQGDNFGALKLLRRVAPGVRLAFSAGVGEGVIPIGNENNRE